MSLNLETKLENMSSVIKKEEIAHIDVADDSWFRCNQCSFANKGDDERLFYVLSCRHLFCNRCLNRKGLEIFVYFFLKLVEISISL